MKNKFGTKLIAITLALTMALSLIPMTAISTSAAISLASLDGWATSQLYVRGLSISGEIFGSLTESVDNENVKAVCSLISKYVFNTNSTGAKLSAIQDTCDEILKTTENTYSVVNDINKKISSNAISVSHKECDDAFENQVLAYTTRYDEASYDFYNVYKAYIRYLDCACDCDDEDDLEDLNDYEEAYIKELRNYYASVTDDYWNNNSGFNNINDYYDYKMYTTNAIDVCITGMIKSMLNNMDSNYSSVSNGRRFIDYAAQYAYYAYPYSNEQAQFIDYAVEYQINAVTTLLMVYQDIVAHRADFLEKSMVDETTEATYTNTWIQLVHSYEDVVAKYADTVGKFLNGKIHLTDLNATTTLDKYARNESVSDLDDDKESFTLTNTSFLSSRKYNGNQCSAPKFTSKDGMSFYKNVSVKVENGELVFTPFYVLNGDALDKSKMYLTTFDINDEDSWGFAFGGLYDTHYLDTDYYNLAQGNYSDGLNSYSPISDVSTLKKLINETCYSANSSSPYRYFAPYLSYGKNNPVYLLLNGKTTLSDGFSVMVEETRYTSFPVFNLSSDNSYANNWNSETMDQYNLQSDRKGSDNKTNSMYSVILAPKSNETKVNINTELYGEGEITVEGSSSTTAVAGEKVELSITAPEDHSILEICVTYNDSNKSKVIYSGTGSNEITFEYPVPYSNITITAQTANVPQDLNVDENGNYLISNYSDLQQMAKMVNSGYEKYAEGSYVVTNDFTACDNGFLWSTPIGTEDSPFEGTFDGQGHTINNLWFDEYSEEEYFGLFGIVDEGTIENLNLVMNTNTSSERHHSLGTICGYIEEGCISNCTVSGDFVLTSDYAGGIVGIADESIIRNCETKLSFTTDRYCFADDICGYNIDSEIVDCTSDNTFFMLPY